MENDILFTFAKYNFVHPVVEHWALPLRYCIFFSLFENVPQGYISICQPDTRKRFRLFSMNIDDSLRLSWCSTKISLGNWLVASSLHAVIIWCNVTLSPALINESYIIWVINSVNSFAKQGLKMLYSAYFHLTDKLPQLRKERSHFVWSNTVHTIRSRDSDFWERKWLTTKLL